MRVSEGFGAGFALSGAVANPGDDQGDDDDGQDEEDAAHVPREVTLDPCREALEDDAAE